MTVTFGSLFSGIGGFDLAFERVGMRCLWQSEIDGSASTVLAHHWPDVPNYGDITVMRGDVAPPVQVICGGFPCQDLSVAGRRAGLDGERSGLFFEFMRIVEEMRAATANLYPELVVIENVPGLFSSNGGTDFGVLLDTLADLGAVDIGWRVLDAQWFGVAQRRRRVFVAVDFGGRRAAEILALAESLSGDSPPSREARETIAGTLGGGSGTRGWAPDTDRMTFVPTNPAVAVPIQNATRGKDQNGIGVGHPCDPMYTLDNASQHAVAFSAKDHGADFGDIAPTLRAMAHDQSHANGGGQVAVAFAQNQRDEVRDLGDVAGALAAEPGMKQQTYVAFAMRGRAEGNVPEVSGDVSPAIRGASGGSTHTHVATQMAVRRLTPRECERLQGFPDDWTLVDDMADSPRYRMLGNAVAVPVAEWIGKRIVSVL